METQSSTSLIQSNELDSVDSYQQAIIDTLLAAIPSNLLPNTLQVVPVFDRESHRYQLLCLGWTAAEKRVFYPVIHIEIRHGQVWIQNNQSELDIGEALSKRGIPKTQIVLGLYPPSVRRLNPVYASGC